MKYTKASAEVVLFDNSDVVTASSLDDTNISCDTLVLDGSNWGHDDICGGTSQVFVCKLVLSNLIRHMFCFVV